MRFIITLLLVTSFLSAGDKIALLIGNNDYSFQPLANPLNDVDGIYKTLREIGFEKNDIKVLKNASKTKMETALANFSQRASSAEIALVYFSGHGMQVNNTNYMFPAKANPTKPVDLFGLVDLNYFIQSASSAKYGIILVDACRTNPLVKYFQNGKHKGSTAKKGLGQVTPKTGQVVIGFATSAGDTADDGNGNMSPYAKALSEWLKLNIDIRNVLGQVGQDVSSNYAQNPIYRSNLASSVYLNKKYEEKTIPLRYSVRTEQFLSVPSYKYYVWESKNDTRKELKPILEYELKRIKVLEAIKKEDDRYSVVKVLVIKKSVDYSKLPLDIPYKTITIPSKYQTIKIKKMLTPQKMILDTQ